MVALSASEANLVCTSLPCSPSEGFTCADNRILPGSYYSPIPDCRVLYGHACTIIWMQVRDLVKPARLDRRRAVASLTCDTTTPGGNEYMSEVLARLSTIQIVRLCLEVHMHRVVLWCDYVLHLYIACKHVHIYSHHLDSKACIAVPSSILLLVDVRTFPAASSVSRSSTLQLP